MAVAGRCFQQLVSFGILRVAATPCHCLLLEYRRSGMLLFLCISLHLAILSIAGFTSISPPHTILLIHTPTALIHSHGSAHQQIMLLSQLHRDGPTFHCAKFLHELSLIRRIILGSKIPWRHRAATKLCAQPYLVTCYTPAELIVRSSGEPSVRHEQCCRLQKLEAGGRGRECGRDTERGRR